MPTESSFTRKVMQTMLMKLQVFYISNEYVPKDDDKIFIVDKKFTGINQDVYIMHIDLLPDFITVCNKNNIEAVDYALFRKLPEG